MNTFIKYILIILLILIMRFIYIKKPIKINDYILVALIGFLLVFCETKNIQLSIFVATVFVLGRTLYRYNASKKMLETGNNVPNTVLFMIAMISILVIIKYHKSNPMLDKYLPYINLAMLTYISISIAEWIGHKQIMHKDITKNMPFLPKYFNNVYKTHIMHHLETHHNMVITESKDYTSVFMSWKVFIINSIVITVILFGISKILSVQLSKKYIVGIAIIISFMWCYLWNKLHPQMHTIDKQQYLYSIEKGPHDNYKFNVNKFNKLLLRNHTLHHKQKGEKKGNYNVILLGADEWFNTNNKDVDNTDFCKDKENKNNNACKIK